MAWAAISQTGEQVIHTITGKLNSQKYVKLLKENLLEMKAIDDYLFTQDLAPCYHATAAIDFLDKTDIGVFNRSQIPPDMNIIDKVWR